MTTAPAADRTGPPRIGSWSSAPSFLEVADVYVGEAGFSVPKLVREHDLLPWLKQWHNAMNPDYGMGLGDYFAGFLDEEARRQNTTVEALNQQRLGFQAEK